MCFTEYGSTVLYKKWVIDAGMNRNVKEQESVFRQAGFNGCIGFSDGTHMPVLKCAQWLLTITRVSNLMFQQEHIM